MATSATQVDAEIADLQALLSSATTFQSIDGQSASFNLQAAQERLSQLLSARTILGQGDGSFRPRNSEVDLSGA